MSITDELRAYATNDSLHYCSDYLAIADRIDAEHQKVEDELKAKNGDMWLKGYAACHEELMEGHPVIAASLEEAGWVKLPKNADGVPIHVGDVLTDDAEFKSEGVVECLMLDETGWMVSFGKGWTDTRIHEWHHHHAPTVEDVLTEMFAKAIERGELTNGAAQTIAEYASKLQLREDA